MNELDWLHQLEQGNEQAYRILFREYYVRLSSFAYKYLENDIDAEDIVQDVLYELWTKQIRFTTLLNLKSYLYNAIRNRCLDTLRRKKVHDKYLQEQQIKEDYEFFLHQIVEQETYLLLKKAIKMLPDQVRIIYELVLIGLDNQMIAEQLNLSIDSVKSHKKRGKKLLKETLPTSIYLLLFTRLIA